MRDFDEPTGLTGSGLDERFGALHRGLETVVPLPPAEQLVARGRRRRQTARAVLAGLAVVASVGAGFLVTGPLRPSARPVPPADGSHSAGVPAYAPPVGSVRQSPGTTIPFGFLPEEGRLDSGRRGLGVQCPGPSQPTSDGEVLAVRSLRDAAGGEVTLLVYPSGPTASRAFDEYRAEVARCADTGDEGLTWRKTAVKLDFGGAAVKVTTRYTHNSEGPLPPARTEVAIRYGSALLLVSGVDPGSVDRTWGGLHDRLCLFARDCQPRGGRPAAVPQLTAGGLVWAAVLATDSTGDPAVLGRAVANAAEMGYRTSIASVDCDAGARDRLGLPAGTPYRYVAVYLASRQEAEAFTAAAKLPPVATVEVRTYCTG